ncbi:MAG: hypothetical protein WDN24_04280 [Sphingomonas sp.]
MQRVAIYPPLLRAILAAAAISWAPSLRPPLQCGRSSISTTANCATSYGRDSRLARSWTSRGKLVDLNRGDYLFNDCLILQTLLLGRSDWRLSVINSTIYLDGEPCRRLSEEVTNRAPQVATYQYSQYVFAARIVTAPLAIAFGIDGAKQLLRIAVYVTLLVTAIASIRRMTRGGQPPQHPATFYFAVLLCTSAMLGAYRLEYYAQTFAHGYSELVIAAFLLYSVTLAPRTDGFGRTDSCNSSGCWDRLLRVAHWSQHCGRRNGGAAGLLRKAAATPAHFGAPPSWRWHAAPASCWCCSGSWY